MGLSLLEKFIEGQKWSFFGVADYSEVKKALEEHEDVFERWASRGFDADMEYLENMKEDRYHPENKLKDVKSVIVLGAWYGNNQDSGFRTQDSAVYGKIAQYARGKDYHKILKTKLLNLSDWLKKQGSYVETYVSVDNGPTVDRVLAQAAGLGFFGKNTSLISPSRGSYFFIASVMTNLELPPTARKPMPNCGTCTRCMDACPTRAIIAPGVIDARKCISYLTIENRGPIPLELRSKIGNRIFGCDACQEVCPFNIGRAGKQEVLIKNLKGEYGAGDSLDLREVLAIASDEAFLAKFSGTPLMRAKRRGLLRNACVIAGNSDDESLIPDLQKLIDREDDEMLREHARWAIDQLSFKSSPA